MPRHSLLSSLSLAIAVALSGCGGGSPPPAARAFQDSGQVDAGSHRMYYALTLTEDLPLEIAESYDIKQRPNLALLMVSVQARNAQGTLVAAGVPVNATRISLLGERDRLGLRQSDTGTVIGTVELRQREVVIIDIEASPGAPTPPLRARITREFILD